jgi:hypothetical protein
MKIKRNVNAKKDTIRKQWVSRKKKTRSKQAEQAMRDPALKKDTRNKTGNPTKESRNTTSHNFPRLASPNPSFSEPSQL